MDMCLFMAIFTEWISVFVISFLFVSVRALIRLDQLLTLFTSSSGRKFSLVVVKASFKYAQHWIDNILLEFSSLFWLVLIREMSLIIYFRTFIRAGRWRQIECRLSSYYWTRAWISDMYLVRLFTEWEW